ncbi:hypothetical protein Si116_01942 [Streptococcus infantarius subsp. infantarius]|nr:hypothetical protein [Streptococcus infantarius subsp. infantarius]MCO4493189.1 hypothetical protein [Streptococcus infantarius subsp. infantarius]MCO4518503.1 hypothetical protein [Streptococcus infantarius subsp. infantarius]MCO4524550.1 hypothetical protein [Streptococcus infantarius subsp. infantarius]
MGDKMVLVKYYRNNSEIYVDAPIYIHQSVKKIVNNYVEYELVDRKKPKKWSVCINEEEYFLLRKYNYERIFQKNEPAITVFYSKDFKTIGLLQETEESWLVQNIVRMVRVILRLQYLEEGEEFFHGGLIRYNNKGICFLGDKKSGKTTSILYLLKNKKAEFISNDDVSFRYIKSQLYGSGWPRAINIRPDTINMLGLNCGNFAQSHPISRLKNDIVCLYPFEISSLFDCKVSDKSRIDYIIFPEFVSKKDIRLEVLDPQCGFKLLERYAQNTPGKYINYLLKYFSPGNGMLDNNKIPKNVKFIKLYQNFDNFNIGMELLDKFIKKNDR